MAIFFMNGQTPTLGQYFPFILMLGVIMIAAPGVPGGGGDGSIRFIRVDARF